MSDLQCRHEQVNAQHQIKAVPSFSWTDLLAGAEAVLVEHGAAWFPLILGAFFNSVLICVPAFQEALTPDLSPKSLHGH